VVGGVLLGIVQGITEWLPVSSEGAVTAAGSLFLDMTTADALAFALWLHLGTAVAATIAFRTQLLGLAREALSDPTHPSPLLVFLVVGTASSVFVGLPILLALDEISTAFGAAGMIAVGALMLITAATQARQGQAGERTRDDLSMLDAVSTGIAQGLAALPGLSRSGLTVAVLLGRGVDRSEALAVSFLMSIPASLGAALFAGLDSDSLRSTEGVVGAVVAMVVGLASIRLLLYVAHRVNFFWFVLLAGVAIMAGGVAQIWL